VTGGFNPPPYPYDRLDPLRALADAHEGGAVDCSVGTPGDPPPTEVAEALARSTRLAGYPPSLGTEAFRVAAADWLERRFGAGVDASSVAACIGTKEFVADLPHLLRLRSPDRDTVLYPEVSYPSYAMGAELAGCRAVAVPMDAAWRIDLSAIDPGDAARAVCLWVNTPGNPAGGLDDLGAAAEWGRHHGVPVFSDECYIEFTWDHGDGRGPVAPEAGRVPGRSILMAGVDGVVAVHSLSKRSNLAGGRVGFYAGDAELVRYLSEVRKHAGRMVPGPVQDAAVVALEDDAHVDVQRDRYWERLARLATLLAPFGVAAAMPAGGFYLWAAAPDGDAWALAERLAGDLGLLVSPGEFYGDVAEGYVRVAAVQPDGRLDVLDKRLADSGGPRRVGS